MKRLGLWLLIAALSLSLLRICFPADAQKMSFAKTSYPCFVYRAPWNGTDQLTLLGDTFNGIIYTKNFSQTCIRQLEKGCYVVFATISFTLPERNRNPGVFNYRNYLLGRGVTYIAQAKERDVQIQDDIPVRYWLRVPGARFRRMAFECIENALGKETGGLVYGIMTGDTSGMEETDREAFRTSGLSHLMAVSGTHVAYVLVPFKRMARNRYCLYRLRNFLLLIPLFTFWLLTDGTPSVTRACLSCGGILLARVLERPPDAANFLMLSAGIQILLNPYIVYNTGFLMSYGAAAGICFVLPFLQKNVAFFTRKKESVRTVRILDRQVLAAGISVNLVLCPLMLYLFCTYSLCGVLLTLYAALPAGLLCAGGYLLCVLSFIPGGGILSFLIIGFLSIIGKILSAMASIGAALPEPFGLIRVPGIPLWVVLLFYLFLLGMIIYGRRIILWIVLFAFSLMSLFGFARLVQPVLSILFMDVGQGAGTLIQADGYTGLVDTGDGKTDLVDVLWAQGITDLDFIVLTHGHQDHIGGLEMILNTYKPRVLYTSQNTEVGLQEVRDLAIRHGIEVCSVSHQNQVKLGSVTMEFLISEASFNQSDESAENNSSLNVRLVCVYGSAIICGDLEEKGIEQLLQMNAFPQSDVLFVPHHGSNSGTSEKMLSNILPKYAIISVGIRNSYGHPGAVTLSNLERIGALVYRTDVVGGISVSFGDTHWFRKRYVEVWQTLS